MNVTIDILELDKLREENKKLRTEFINLFSVIESGDWSVAGLGRNPIGYMTVNYVACEDAIFRAEKVIAEFKDER